MSCVSVNLGQCGTQIGHALMESLHNEATTAGSYGESACQSFFNQTSSGGCEARCVMIDMEPKAIGNVIKATKKKGWSYAPKQQFFYNSGSGNNWAFGFNKLGPRFDQVVMDMIRREVEKCDSLDGFLVLMSVAGGTGAGVGSYYLNRLREIYPRATIVNPYVLPYSQGEVAVQYYNATLSLATMNARSDVCLTLHNNSLHDTCINELLIKDVSFAHINRLAARQLASVLLPTAVNAGSRNRLRDLVLAVGGGGAYKMVDMFSTPNIPEASIPFTSFSWRVLGRGVDKTLGRRLNEHTRMKAALFVLRGAEAQDYQLTDDVRFNRFSTRRVRVWRCNKPLGKYDKSLTCLTNGSACVEPLVNVASKSWKLFTSSFYLHQYYKHGLDESDFRNSIATLQGVVAQYQNL